MQHLDISNLKEIPAIYDATQNQLVDIICRLDDKYDFVGLVGHNPGIAQMVYYLSDQARDVPPGAVALIEFDTDSWKAVSGGTGKLSYYDSPKED